MQVILNTGKKNLHGLNGKPVDVKEIVDARVSVVVAQASLPAASRRGTEATRTLDFLPSDIVEFVGTLNFPVDVDAIAANGGSTEGSSTAEPTLFDVAEEGEGEDTVAEAVASEDLTNAAPETHKKGGKK